MDDAKGEKHPSLFAAQIAQAVERWIPHIPGELRPAFRVDFQRFGWMHDGALTTLEGIWEGRERVHAVDESTGLATRRSFRDHLTTLLLQQHGVGHGVVGLLFIDVNNLKRINDSCGHPVGDRALAAVGAILRETLRVERGTDVVARAEHDTYAVGRHGGDEFVAAVQLVDAEALAHVALRIKRRADDPAHQRAHGYAEPVELSIAIGGIAHELPDAPPSSAPNVIAAALLAAADALMYRSKKDGGVHVARARFSHELEVHSHRRLPPGVPAVPVVPVVPGAPVVPGVPAVPGVPDAPD